MVRNPFPIEPPRECQYGDVHDLIKVQLVKPSGQFEGLGFGSMIVLVLQTMNLSNNEVASMITLKSNDHSPELILCND